MEACAPLEKARAEAENMARIAAGAKTLANSPDRWCIGEPPVNLERRRGDGMPIDIEVDLEGVGISARTWPVVGSLLVLRQNYLDAVATVEKARRALSPNEQALIAKGGRTGR